MQVRSPGGKAGSYDAWGLRAYRYLKKNWVLYLFLLPAFVDVFIFRYLPMYGIQIAFKNYKVRSGILGSDWVGLQHFVKFVRTPNFLQILRNTVLLSLYNLVFGFPIPIALAIIINEIRSPKLKKVTQMLTYMPHFISLVAVVGLINLVLNRESGIVNILLTRLGMGPIGFMGMSSAYRSIYVVSEVWQHAGWGTIIYLAALSNVDMDSLDAAKIDGASRMQKILHIDLPTLMPSIAVLLILRAGSVLNVGFEKVFLLQNDLNRDVSEVISIYIYRLGILGGQFSYTTAIGLFNNVVNAALLVLVNQLYRMTGEDSLW